VSSEPFWVEISITQDGKYKIGFNRAENIDAAEKFAQSPVVYVVTPNKSQQTAVSVKPDVEVAPVVAERVKSAPQTVAPVSRQMVEGVTHPSAELMLHYWWQQADKKQREAFLKAVKVN
jgi:uncharacterized protein YccT (UPF0319 family)